MMVYAMVDAIRQFARVFHVRDLICPYAETIPSLPVFLKAHGREDAPMGWVKGLPALVPIRHEDIRDSVPIRHEDPAEQLRGAAVGGGFKEPPSSTHLGSVASAKAANPLKACAYAHGTYARNRACNARYRSKIEYIVQYGHSVILDNNCAH